MLAGISQIGNRIRGQTKIQPDLLADTQLNMNKTSMKYADVIEDEAHCGSRSSPVLSRSM